MKSPSLGVCVVRLQVPELHDGHRYLLNMVTGLHANVLVFIGVTEARLTVEDPLTFEMRASMLKKLYPNVTVLPITDHPLDHVWSARLDDRIDINSDPMLPPPVLYGGRDSFLQHYSGKNRTFELPPAPTSSGTDAREAVEVKDTPDFRAGMIFASKHKFPISYQCVDAAIRGHDGKFLLGQKAIDNGKWRFIGGFVSPADDSLETAVRREVREETGIEPGDPQYMGSAQINDFRYPKHAQDRLMSAFFLVPCTFGAGKAADDIDATRWFDITEIAMILIDEHQPLLTLLLNNHDWSY